MPPKSSQPPQPPPPAASSAATAALEDACRILLLNEDASVFQLATETLFTIIQNVIQHPAEDKYRRIRRSAKAFQEKLGPAKGAVRLLKSVGFVEEGEGTDDAAFVLSAEVAQSAPLTEAKAVLKAVVKHRFEVDMKAKEAARAQQNAEGARKLAELKEISKQNTAQVTAEQEAERQRLLKGLQIDREDRERQKDPMQWK